MNGWWNKNAEKRLSDFKAWVGPIDQPSKVYCRSHVIKQQYKTIIDCGCGLAIDCFGYKSVGSRIKYTGLDSCKYFNKLNAERGVAMVEAELETDLPIADNSYDVSYCREVIEHLSYY